MRPEFCWGFKVFNFPNFFPVYGVNVTEYFNTTIVDATLEKTKKSIAVHMYGSGGKMFKIYKSERSAYRVLMEQNCPKVYEAAEEVF